MVLDLQKFYQACNPSKTLAVENPEDRKYYIDFCSVRGGKIIEELKENITFFSPDEPTCELFTGHIGCGKSTELLRLKAELEQVGFHVVYFESSQDLEMGDVDIGDILLAIARRVSESLDSLEKLNLPEPLGLKKILQGAAKLLTTEIEVSAEAMIPGLAKVAAGSDGKFSAEATILGLGELKLSEQEGISLVAAGIGKISAKAKNSPELRNKLKEYLGPRTKGILDVINEELLLPAIAKLKQQGKKGLVVIVDNLDRVETTAKSWGRPQPEYLFIDRGEQLTQLKCHVLYTMPLELMFSNDLSRLTQRFMVDPKVLPMVPVKLRDGSECGEGIALLRQMVLARAFPEVAAEYRLALITELFDTPETLNRLCCVSGGHVRELLRLLNDWIKKERKLPLSRETLEAVIRAYCNQMTLAITHHEWELLRQVQQRKWVSGDEGYRVLVHSRFVYEYRDTQGSWFEINPILAEASALNQI
ncbi:ATP-binding protein [Calothrix sp. FACHB-1219]|uniref:ATP-binding protein n=1 Tax=unclassified Calothrix TaxID=2619626 RepID=UPI00168651C1|nr:MULTISPECIES: ATP-binding protein [unclassified Calothrix]MBD2202216.1 ATP-binding protein [Calothrix sp. FACHB-168]MBD2217623.1 ATP-binding protein [Calothrix sp. FACHB-1219]